MIGWNSISPSLYSCDTNVKHGLSCIRTDSNGLQTSHHITTVCHLTRMIKECGNSACFSESLLATFIHLGHFYDCTCTSFSSVKWTWELKYPLHRFIGMIIWKVCKLQGLQDHLDTKNQIRCTFSIQMPSKGRSN